MSLASPDGVAGPWRKSSYSNTQGGDCVEVRDDLPGLVPIRDSKDPGRGTVRVSDRAWRVFLRVTRG
ncbi:DUF397 domain-containing protein [Streptomyces albidoflavus]|uniref:DUF397 domain-containing protein n=1 Tax=Streptomyces albidoflavus TaxID=1886 RepID=A0A2A2UGY5_9ACTN|nr:MULTISPECIES: DUF397 domain-containing protein [Streptomyces]MCG5119887.1 DUF397 domain-containing protein [Streptomyces sp. T7(2022)]MCK2142550.1 DUF397 domain-containing protein [Streptomyces sp. WAC00276]MCQ9706290.1 DUF397 domain-containing protein [Streptomyces sp. BSP1]OWA09512.1 DUF397 domain-containing protein [Streptomyces sp. CS227]PKA35411.1 DUF397 domain-containing protein [Streptomyces sp. SM8]QPA00182.1 DUF397 domain-containing protein [Streptomyces violascens]UDF11265.1 DUF